MAKITSLVPFYLAAFLVSVVLGVVASIGVPLFAGEQLKAGILFLMWIGALGALFYTPFVILFGRLIDRFNRKLLLTLGCLIFTATYILMSRVRHLYQILLIYPLGTIGMSMFWPSIQSWLALGLDRERLSRSLGIFNVGWSAGWMVGPFIGGLLYEAGYKVPFLFASTLTFLIIFMLARQPLILEEVEPTVRTERLNRRGSGESEEGSGDTPFEEEARVPNRRAFLSAALVANFMSWFFIGIMRFLFPKLGTYLGMEPWVIGSLVALFGLSQTAMFIILKRTQRWQYRLMPLVSIQCLASLGLLVILFFRSALVLSLAFVLLGISGGMTYFSSIFYSLYGYLDKGRKSGVHEACIGAGSFFGPLVGGISSHIFSTPKAPYGATFILMVVAIAVEVGLVRGKLGHPAANIEDPKLPGKVPKDW